MTEAFHDVADPAWSMLMVLYIAAADHRHIGVSSLCLASGVPATTALRHIGKLQDEGAVTDYPDEHDMRRRYVRLSPRAIARIDSTLTDIMKRLEGGARPR